MAQKPASSPTVVVKKCFDQNGKISATLELRKVGCEGIDHQKRGLLCMGLYENLICMI